MEVITHYIYLSTKVIINCFIEYKQTLTLRLSLYICTIRKLLYHPLKHPKFLRLLLRLVIHLLQHLQTRYGQLHTIEGGFIKVKFSKENNMLIISIIDNGIGRKGSKEKEKSSAHTSMAMDITRKRIKNLNKKHKTNGSLLVNDYNEELEIGTKILISLPYAIAHNKPS